MASIEEAYSFLLIVRRRKYFLYADGQEKECFLVMVGERIHSYIGGQWEEEYPFVSVASGKKCFYVFTQQEKEPSLIFVVSRNKNLSLCW